MKGKGLNFATLVTVLCFSLLAAAQTNAQRYSGRATAIKTTVGVPNINPLTTAINDTGELPAAGGNITLTSANTSIANAALTAGASSSTTRGGTPAGTSHSETSVVNLNFTVLGNVITATAVSSITDCSCPAQTCSGSSTITGLTLNGTPVAVTGSPNQTITLLPGGVGAPVGTLVINQQIDGNGSKTVNALHVNVTEPATGIVTDIIVASSHSDIICSPFASDNFYSGRAYGVGSTVTTNTIGLGTGTVATLVDDTGSLPSSGGVIGPVIVAGANLPGLLGTGTLTSSTSGGLSPGGTRVSDSSSTVQNLNVTVQGFTITATVLTSQTHCQCPSPGTIPTCTGGSVITNLVITPPVGGTITGTINSTPNNTITLNVLGTAVATIITNEQIPLSPTNSGAITANAFHLITTTSVPGVSTSATNTIVASSHSDIVCGAPLSTAGGVTVSGRVLNSYGRGVKNALVTLTGQTGEVFSARTGSRGNFQFEDIPAGQSYLANIRSKLYSFSPQLITVNDSVTGLRFVAEEVTADR